jgi:hypothetical protein
MQFYAEVVEVRIKKMASLDKMIRIVLETEEESALQLQQYIAQFPIFVTAENKEKV